MQKQLIDPNDAIRFLNVAIDEEGKSNAIDMKGMTGKGIEVFLNEFGSQFPIIVASHTVVNDKNEAYMIVDGKKIKGNKEKIDKIQEAQKRKGLLDSQKGLEH